MNLIEKINSAIDKHFKSNKGNYQVDRYANPEMADWLSLSRDCRRTPGVDARWVCVFIFRNYSDIQVITIGTWIFTRSTLNRAGSRFHV